MITKTETLNFIESVKEKLEKGDKLLKTQAPQIVKNMIKSSKTAEEFYLNFGRGGANMDSEFNDIAFREDCYDYLIECGVPKDKAFKLTDIIRKGRFNFLNDTTEYDNFLERSFIKWAKGVKYLTYRERCVEVFRVLFKDNEDINRRSKQEDQLKELAKMIRNGDYQEQLLPKPRYPYDHKLDHNYCDFSSVKPGKITEKRICRCWNFYNKANRDAKCDTCPFEFKKKNIGSIEIVDFEVPTKFNIAKLGGIDWLLKDGDKIYATEVKPPKSTETLVRMIAEILTYTVDSDYKPAICFFTGSKQYRDYRKYKDNQDFQYIIKQTGIRVLCITFNEDCFEIHDVENMSISKNTGIKNENYETAVKERMSKKYPEQLVGGTFKGKTGYSHIFKDLKNNFIDGKYPIKKQIKGNLVDELITYNCANHLNSSQAMCISYFKKFFESEENEKLFASLLKKLNIDIGDNKITDAIFEYEPDFQEGTNFDFYLQLSNGNHISWEIKFTEKEFGGTNSKGAKDKYIKKWRKIYSSMMMDSIYHEGFPINCDEYLCLCTGILTDECCNNDKCSIHEFYKYYQIRRNIIYAKQSEDYVIFLTPKENRSLDAGRKYIDDFAIKYDTDKIRNIYWEDLLDETLKVVSCNNKLHDYYTRFKAKYFE